MDASVKPDIEKSFAINKSACAWTMRAMTALQARVRVNIRLHDPEQRLENGQIFLFNHFARFETFIPQYLIHQRTGAYCRSVASREFFSEGNVFSNYLLGLGAVPNNYPNLLPFLGAEIFRGRKVIVFPEGGMVKDRRAIDDKGEFNIYSRAAKERRKHHTGAAVLALTLDAFKTGLLELEKANAVDHLSRWAANFGLDGVDALLAEARRPTLVVPSNITFYPIRVSDNLFGKLAEFFSKGKGKLRNLSEEFLIEGNILLKNTDMDIRLGIPARAHQSWSWWERKILSHLLRKTESLEEFFRKEIVASTLEDRLLHICVGRHVFSVRDAYMREMYTNVTVNLSHLASQLILSLIGAGKTEIERKRFDRILYLAVKAMQKHANVHLHDSLRNPDAYEGILEDRCEGLEQFISSATMAGLLAVDGEQYSFLPKLREEHDFDKIRIENPIAVYANEVAPIPQVKQALEGAMEKADRLSAREWAEASFDDMLLSFAWGKKQFTDPRYDQINKQETATENAEPYLLLPENSNGLGIVLVHGFLASPAELREFGQRLFQAGHPVIGVRLNGHGTSPWDLRGRAWQNWMEPVRKGYRILSAFADRVCLVGFSSGGALSLILASEAPAKLAGVVAVSAPLKFMNRNMIFVPFVHGANRVTRWMSTMEGIMPFRENDSEHPHINYRHMAIRGLFELRRMVDEMERRLPKIACPVTLIQGDEDRIVNPKSLELMYKKLATKEKTARRVPSTRHGILNENIANTQEIVLGILADLRARQAAG